MKKKIVTKKPKQKLTDDPSPSYDSSPSIPDELILQSIVTRLPTRKIFQFKLVSKFWCDSISNDSGFALSHFARHQNKTILSFNLFNVLKENEEKLLKEDDDEDYVFNEDEDEDNVLDGGDGDLVRNYFFGLQKNGSDIYSYDFNLLSKSDPPDHSIELVGNCNGLACVKRLRVAGFEEIFIINHVTRETLNLTRVTPEIGVGRGSLNYLCHGFGFDSLSNEYKIVLIYTTSTIDGVQGFICMVVTLGGNSWRKIVASACDISAPPSHSPFPSKMVTTMWRDDHRYSTPCGNDLLWMVTNTDSDDGNKNQMLLSFDVHNEKMQFIRLPPEYNSLISTFQRDGSLEITYHLLEFKGCPCVARSEREMILKSKEGHQVFGNPGSSSNRFWSYDIEVNLYILEDKIEQTWIEEKTYNVSLYNGSVVPASPHRNPFLRYFSSTTSRNQVSPPTRMLGFSDRVILYWFDGGCLIFYDLEMKHHNLAKGIKSRDGRTGDVFVAKMMEVRPHPHFGEDIDDNERDCPCIDYQLHLQAENIVSLKTFVPKEGEVGAFGCSVKSNFNNL